MDISYKKLNADITPEVLGNLSDQKILFESSNGNKTKNRYSILVFDTYGELYLNNKSLVIKTLDGNKKYTSDIYEEFKKYIDNYYSKIDIQDLEQLPFISGFVGSFSFDIVRHAYPKLNNIKLDGTKNDALLHMVESAYVFDHFKEKLYLVTSNLFSNVSKESLNKRLEKMEDKLKSVKIFEKDIDFSKGNKEIIANNTDSEFVERVEYLKGLIQKGDMYQIQPSRIYSYKHKFGTLKDPLSYQLYRNLKRQNPSPYMYYINMGYEIIVGSSPESFVKTKGKTVVTNPIAGTIKRGKNNQEDLENEKELLNDEKELSEHRMLVDLGRNDINKISKLGTMKIQRLMEIEKFEHLMHIVSVVDGELKDNLSPVDIIMSLLPTGTVSGAPKIRAIERIYETAPVKRGIYSGGIGYINCNQDLDFALAIRTMLIDEEYVNVQAACGVVYDSIPEKELEETKLKARSLLLVDP
ncbi:anthranilate synthase component I [Staphylococcus succinus]|nr:anthranilate synthase component I [Staphylococcus succinus]